MKKYISIVALAIIGVTVNAFAVESADETTADKVNDVTRNATSTVNRIEEATCMESDTECLKQKAANRLEESKDAISDKASEIKNAVDSDGDPNN
jgi:hypothetical protein